MTGNDIKTIADMVLNGMQGALDTHRHEALTLVRSLVRQELETTMRDEILRKVQKKLQRGVVVKLEIDEQ